MAHLALRAILVLLAVDATVLGIAVRRYFNARACTCPRCSAGLDHHAAPLMGPSLELILPELTVEPVAQAQHAHAR